MEKKGFRVIVEEMKDLFKYFHVGNETRRDFEGNTYKGSYQLGGAPLEKPAKEIMVSGRSTGSKFSLEATIYAAYKSEGSFDHYSLVPSSEKLAQFFPIKKIGEVVFVLDEKGKEEFAIYQADESLGCIDIEAGSQGGFHSFSSPPKTITSLKNFEKDILRFARIIEVVVNGLYEELGKESPDITLYLRPSIDEPKPEERSLAKLAGGVERELLKKAIEVETPNVSFSDIGGQEKAKKEVQGLSFALRNPALYKKWGTKPPKGILLFGPPGTGKTLLAKALASEAKAKFYNVKISDISSMWYGQSEKLMQAVFDIAKESGKSIIFFDEVDAIAAQRDHSHEATQRTIATLLENLDGLEACPNIMVVASTNRIEAVDPALKRPGRIDRLVEVPLPDDEGRRQIFTIHTGKAVKIAERALFDKVDWDSVVRQTDKMSGADLAEIIRRVLEEKVRKEGIGENGNLVTTDDILKEIKTYERVKEAEKRIGF